MKIHSLVLIFGLTATTMGYTAEPAPAAVPGPSPSQSSCTPDTIVFNFPSQELSQAEKEGILLLLSQEKLLRDVYAKLYEKWQLPEFQNIPSGEDRHAKGVKALLKKYQLTAPNADKVGVFAEAKLTQQYQDLVAKGGVSLVEALTVLASLEEQDAVALEKAITGTDNFDVQFVYKQLAKGSRNHLRDLVGLLQGKGTTYKPVFYSAADFQKVLDSSKEKYLYDDPSLVPCKQPKIQEKLQIEGKPNLRSPQAPPVIGRDHHAAPEGEEHEGSDRD